MKYVMIFILLIVIVACVLYPNLSGADLGDKIVGNNNLVMESIANIKPLADVGKVVMDITTDIVKIGGGLIRSLNNVWTNIVGFFAPKTKTCEWCGKDYTSADCPDVDKHAGKPEGKVYCIHCKRYTVPSGSYCTRCGRPHSGN